MFICNQKVNFITSFFFEILQRYYRFAIFGTLGMPDVTSKNDTINLYKILMFIFMQKIIFIPPLFLEILQRYRKLVILGAFGIPGHTHQKM